MGRAKYETRIMTSPAILRERCLNHFDILRIPITPDALDAALLRAEKEALPHLGFLDLVLGDQATKRRERSIERRIRDAHFAETKTLESFDWNFNKKAIDRQQMEQLATGEFIQRRTNLIMIGQSGVGKSHLVQAIGRKACALGYHVLYRTSAQLISDLTASLADKTLPQKLRHYSRPQLLIIDEWGFDRVERLESPQAAHLLYKVIASRNQQCSTALVSNIDFDRWGDYLADGPLAMGFVDRLIEGAIIIKIKGDSYRARRNRNGKSSSQDSAAATPETAPTNIQS
jgi:DNA replication protein DnaC